MRSYSFFWLFAVILAACHSAPHTDLPQIDIYPNAPQTKLHISDLAEDFRIVPLETSDSILLPNSFQVFTAGKYLVICGDQYTYLFSGQGEYLGKLLTQGRGADEYSRLSDCRIDENRQHLYLLDAAQHLFIYDLAAQRLLTTLSLPFKAAQIQEIKGDTLFYYIPFTSLPENSPDYVFCRMTLDSEVTEYIRGESVQQFIFDERCYRLPTGEIRFRPKNSDTLYTIGQHHKAPFARLKYKANKPGYKFYVYPSFENSHWYIIQSSFCKEETDSQGNLTSVTLNIGDNFLIDKNSSQTQRFTEILVDTLNTAIKLGNIQIRTPDLIIPVNILQFKENLKEKYEQNLLAPELKQLYENVQESDNPILLIGKLKA